MKDSIHDARELAVRNAGDLARGRYVEAIDAYRQFMKFHPTHEMVANGYASFRIGESYYKMLPESWFLVPPAFEMDNSPTIDALRELL